MKTTDGMGRAELLARIDELEAQKNGAYAERDRCVALIAAAARKLGHPVGFAEHSADDASWDREWRNIVFVELPTGQVSWHIHDSEKPWFAELGAYMTPWDGHTTEQKYARVAETTRQWFADVFDHEALERATADYAERVAGLNAAIEASKTPTPTTLSERTHWIRVEWAAGFVARRAELATSESLRMRIDTLGEILCEDFEREPPPPDRGDNHGRKEKVETNEDNASVANAGVERGLRGIGSDGSNGTGSDRAEASGVAGRERLDVATSCAARFTTDDAKSWRCTADHRTQPPAWAPFGGHRWEEAPSVTYPIPNVSTFVRCLRCLAVTGEAFFDYPCWPHEGGNMNPREGTDGAFHTWQRQTGVTCTCGNYHTCPDALKLLSPDVSST